MKRLFLCFVLTYLFTYLHAQKQDHVNGQLLVQLINSHKINDLHSILSRYKAELLNSRCISKTLNIWQLQLDENTDEKVLLSSLRAHPSVLTAQLNHYVQLRTALVTVPNDPFFANQWYLNNTGQTGGTVGADIRATQAWDITTGGLTTDGDTIVVAVIDNGFEPTHPDIQPNNWYNWKEIPKNGIDDDLNGFIDDFAGWNVQLLNDSITGGSHALQVSGVLGASGNNNRGVSGVSWKVKIMSIRIDTDNGTEADVVAAYDYALVMRQLYQKSGGKKGAFVVATNSSFGSNGFASDAPLWCAMYDSLGTAGVLNIGSTANSNINVDIAGDLPSTCPSDYLVMVTSSDKNDVKDSGAAFGVTHVDVAAPGVGIYTTAQNGSYVMEEGTSFAAPIVAGIVALAYATPCNDFINLSKSSPKTAALFLKDWIMKSVDLKTDFANKIKSGGRVNAFKTLQKVLANCGSCQQPSSVVISTTKNQATITFKTSANATFSSRYRRKNDTNWIVINSQSLPLSIDNLTECSDYELEVKTNCSGDISSPYILSFKTQGCCVPPEQIQIKDVTQSQFKMIFSSVAPGLTYKVCLKDVESNDCIFDEISTDTSFTFKNLSVCRRYQVSIRSNCSATGSSEANIQVKTAGCGACFDLKYCTSKGSSVSEWIDSFAVAGFNFKSGKNSGYARFDTVAATFKSGRKYRFALKPAFSGPLYNESARVWIDYNGDGDFDDAGERIWEALKFNATVISDSILIPNSITEGITRMRVSMKYVGTGGTPPNPCDNFDGGEVEDYCVRLEKTTGLSPLISGEDIKVYPNPFSDYFILKNDDVSNKIMKIELMYPDGRIFYAKQWSTNENEYLVADLPPLSINLIFMKVETEKGIFVKKMIRF